MFKEIFAWFNDLSFIMKVLVITGVLTVGKYVWALFVMAVTFIFGSFLLLFDRRK